MILLCISSGRGPAECRQAVRAITNILRREALELGLEVGAEDPGEAAASLLVTIDGENAEGFARSWEGTVQWIAKSQLRPGHKRKNWFVAVHRLPAPPTPAVILPSEVQFDTMRAGGPGGQHQNRTESAVRAKHLPTGLSVVVRDQRSQHRNKALALARLASLLAAVEANTRERAASRDWLQRIHVDRGNPVRVLEAG
ncbi:MAG: peptide chain release factor H [Alphaproteobacteria bacterium]|nr:peptide chain release factor H [Alphaproteobacteria bacterium]